MKKNEKGITIVALVVTIIVMLILAGITMKELSDNSIISQVQEETNSHQEGIENEQKKMDEVKSKQLEDWGF